MRLTESDLRESGVYVKDDGRMVRIIDAITGDQVHYHSFWITGEYDGSSSCGMTTFMQWIGKQGREATETEISQLQIENANQAEYARFDRAVRLYLSQATDEQLRAEVHRRGWKLA